MNELTMFVNQSSKKEIIKLRQSYKEHDKIDDYLYKISKKIFTKLVFPYVRFEILLRTFKDIINNAKYYPNIDKKELKRINKIFIRLQKICLHLNFALEEYRRMLLYVEKDKY